MRFAILLMLLILPLFLPVAYGAEPVCELEQYYAPDDEALTKPLAKPHPALIKMRRLAIRGDATQQYNLARVYELGTMVSGCLEKAEYWYRKAAFNGNQNAQDWVAREYMESRKSSVPVARVASDDCAYQRKQVEAAEKVLATVH